MRTTWLFLGLSGLVLGGCSSVSRAVPYAAYRSGCEADDIHVVEQSGNEAILDVCGQYEHWSWNGFDGWLYVGPGPAVVAPPNAAQVK